MDKAQSDMSLNSMHNTHCVHAMDGKKFVGEQYHCELCNDLFKARTTWQKFCAKCGQEKRKNYKRQI